MTKFKKSPQFLSAVVMYVIFMMQFESSIRGSSASSFSTPADIYSQNTTDNDNSSNSTQH
jgi:hypothetical protein